MPRTKAVRKKEKNNKLAEVLIPILEESKEIIRNRVSCEIEDKMGQIRSLLSKSKLSVPKTLANKTISELMDHAAKWSGNNTTVSIQILNATKNATLTEKKNKKIVTRSSSCGDDEGYLTAESSKNSSGGRQSRARSRIQKATRTSSLSSRSSKRIGSSVDRFKTPAHRVPPQNFATVTPKMKPNTPQVVLRRPKMGEIAMSMQGSPLMTGPVVSDNVANINIPLVDGRLMTIQPERGLRMSQIPQLDPETKRQLETLRDNLNKMCALSQH